MNAPDVIRASIFAIVVATGSTAAAMGAAGYPTPTVAEYVYGCMKANGENREMLDRCSCSIDVIASIIPYEHYVTAETFKGMGLVAGEKGTLFRETAPAKAAMTELKRAQAEADIRCF
ncbi:hypothetical protein [Ciceribacter azotifigens]|uniref:hypothetical protein n=1 Tax=Ciceribacter azotifigens TaxID=2069303 RepID=UPI003A84C482